ncbi:hypothetical protein QR680_003266 [Steinernema hermaphroditum]|uniref:receptor protein serine/threonine kinase n=1 Tax=Steinernema hermaphroditum TaxID=289476 RepID=A0AA39LJD3_9BILA|nr:hypothetical protein QR680_003266 [Steinernema hermaphroditum]
MSLLSCLVLLFCFRLFDGFGLREKPQRSDDDGAIDGLPEHTDVYDLKAKLRALYPDYNRHRGNKMKSITKQNLCFCNEDEICDLTEKFNKEERIMETWHVFGCAPLENGSNGSHLTCNGYRPHHNIPLSISCCYEGNYCNKHIKPHPYSNAIYPHSGQPSAELSSETPWMPFMIVSIVIALMVSGVIATFLYSRSKELPEKPNETAEKTPLKTANDSEPVEDELSGSGSGAAVLNNRTIAMMLELDKEVVGKGRYGEVRRAMFRGSKVAVKTFYTTEEESWRNEREIYQTQMLNHENILQFKAADISSVDSMTQMLLITDFHELGSLYDYLRRAPVTLEEAISLAFTTICGIEHIHNPVRGTGNQYKPQIAHRDIKSKNVIVKRKGVCCIADFGLAVRFEDELLPRNVKIRVGTKRYMSPEVLAEALDPYNFDAFKLSDIYSFSMLLWEILVGVDFSPFENKRKSHETLSSLNDGEPRRDAVSVPRTPVEMPKTCNGKNKMSESNNSSSNSSGRGSSNSLGHGSSSSSNSSETSNSSGRGSSGSSGHGTASRTNSQCISLSISNDLHAHHDALEAIPEIAVDNYNKVPSNCAQIDKREITNSEGNPSGLLNSNNAIESEWSLPKKFQRRIPFEGDVEPDPSFVEMQKVVCQQKQRPYVVPKWTDGSDPIVTKYYNLMNECWSEQPNSRHTSLKIKMTLAALLDEAQKVYGEHGRRDLVHQTNGSSDSGYDSKSPIL